MYVVYHPFGLMTDPKIEKLDESNSSLEPEWIWTL